MYTDKRRDYKIFALVYCKRSVCLVDMIHGETIALISSIEMCLLFGMITEVTWAPTLDKPSSVVNIIYNENNINSEGATSRGMTYTGTRHGARVRDIIMYIYICYNPARTTHMCLYS